jgi:hypothetical protein
MNAAAFLWTAAVVYAMRPRYPLYLCQVAAGCSKPVANSAALYLCQVAAGCSKPVANSAARQECQLPPAPVERLGGTRTLAWWSVRKIPWGVCAGIRAPVQGTMFHTAG